MTARNRSEGWSHAKISGHQLEEQLSRALETNVGLSSTLHEDCFGSPDSSEASSVAGGIDAGHVKCILGGMTPSKTDLIVRWRNGRVAKLSLKKSAGGQVWLISPDRFIAGFEAQFDVSVPEPVRRGLKLFIGPLSHLEMQGALAGRAPCGITRPRDGQSQELHQRRFVARTLEVIAPHEWEATIQWLSDQLPRIVELCFSRGLCSEPDAQADFIWYYISDEMSNNLIESRVIPINAVIRSVSAMPQHRRIRIGPRNGGSTLLLPFGFVQMHRPKGENQVQFHHGLDALKRTLEL